MPVLKNSRQELYCQHRAKGLTIDEAYVKAGFKANRSNASRLNANDHIQARIAEIQGLGAQKAAFTVSDMARQLDEDRDFARELKQGAAAVSASMGKAKVLGLITEKHIHGLKRLEDMNEMELAALVGEATAQPVEADAGG